MKGINALGLSDFHLENVQIGSPIFSIGCGVGLEAARRKTSVRLVTRKPITLVLQWESGAEVSPSASLLQVEMHCSSLFTMTAGRLKWF